MIIKDQLVWTFQIVKVQTRTTSSLIDISIINYFLIYLTFGWVSFNVGHGPPICPLAAFDLAASVNADHRCISIYKGTCLKFCGDLV